MNFEKELTLGLDWDETVTDYQPAFGVLANKFKEIVIITLNTSITVPIAAATLNVPAQQILVEICPDDRVTDFDVWKAQTCQKHKVTLMFDDDPDVVSACLAMNIPAIRVGSRIINHGFSYEQYNA